MPKAAFPKDLSAAEFMRFNRSWLDLEAAIYEVYVDESKFTDAGLGLFAAKGAYGYIL